MHFNRTVRNFVVESSCDVNEAFKWELSYVITARPSTSATAKKSCLTSTESLLSSTRPLLDLLSSGDQHEAVYGSSVVRRPARGRCWSPGDRLSPPSAARLRRTRLLAAATAPRSRCRENAGISPTRLQCPTRITQLARRFTILYEMLF